VKLTDKALETLWHRAVLALVLLAFLVPGPARLPADEIRAAYVSAGLLCDPDEQGQTHRDPHCVLCLLPAVGAAPDAVGCNAPTCRTAVILAATEPDRIGHRNGVTHHARAPPSIV